MPTAKHVRFASTNVLYSLTSPPSTLTWGETFTKRRRGDSFSGVASSASSSSSSYLHATSPHNPETPIGIPPVAQPRSRSRTSSPSASSSSRSSSQGTPHLNPHSLPLPPPNTISHQTPLQLHYLLAYSPFVNSCIKYDLSLHPSILADHYSSSSLLEPATNPSVSSLTIKSSDLPWPIFITPSPFLSSSSSSSGTPPYVTVIDVLNSLYHDLRMTVHKSEYDSVNPTIRSEIDAAFWRRCRWSEGEASKGVKRVDFLMGRNRFLGLSGTRKGGMGVWELNVSEG